MIKLLLNIILITASTACFAQQKIEEKLVMSMKEFHQALVNKNTVSLNQQTDRELSYGHSNGAVQNKKELIADIESGKTNYVGFREDSIVTHVNGKLANVRFKAEIDVETNGVKGTSKLRIIEVWVKKSSRWVLFARQATKQ